MFIANMWGVWWNLRLLCVQKSACAVILGPEYRSYEEACIRLSIETLEKRREQLAYTFATKSAGHPEHKHWFVENHNIVNTRSKKPAYIPPRGRTQRFTNSPLPYLTDLLNANNWFLIYVCHQWIIVTGGDYPISDCFSYCLVFSILWLTTW